MSQFIWQPNEYFHLITRLILDDYIAAKKHLTDVLHVNEKHRLAHDTCHFNCLHVGAGDPKQQSLMRKASWIRFPAPTRLQ